MRGWPGHRPQVRARGRHGQERGFPLSTKGSASHVRGVRRGLYEGPAVWTAAWCRLAAVRAGCGAFTRCNPGASAQPRPLPRPLAICPVLAQEPLSKAAASELGVRCAGRTRRWGEGSAAVLRRRDQGGAQRGAGARGWSRGPYGGGDRGAEARPRGVCVCVSLRTCVCACVCVCASVV